jgi:pimeloyl-ACP methyl ester carboxylesterase
MRQRVQDSPLREVRGTPLDVIERGHGRPILVLHGFETLGSEPPLYRMVAERARVVAPSHPGYGASPLPDWIDSVDDLSYLYLDLVAELDLADIVLVGLSLGAWIAAEMAVKCAHRLSRLVLVSPLGIKVGNRETRDIPDVFALAPDEVRRLLWHDRGLAPDWATIPEAEGELLLRQQEAAALYLWEPYMHNPKLRRRLGRIGVPTLVLRGESDGLVSQEYAEAYCAAIRGARLETLAGCGHVPEYEQPAALAAAIARFAGL